MSDREVVEIGSRFEVIEVPGGIEVLEVSIPGPPGPPGTAGGSTVYTFGAAATQWVINHGLGYRPAIRLYTLAWEAVIGEIVHTSALQAVANFAAPTTGYATI